LIIIGWKKGDGGGGLCSFGGGDRNPYPALIFTYSIIRLERSFKVVILTILSCEAVVKMSPSADQAQSRMILAWDLSIATRAYSESRGWQR